MGRSSSAALAAPAAETPAYPSTPSGFSHPGRFSRRSRTRSSSRPTCPAQSIASPRPDRRRSSLPEHAEPPSRNFRSRFQVEAARIASPCRAGCCSTWAPCRRSGRESVDANYYGLWLPGPDIGELRFLVIGGHEESVGNCRKQDLTGLHEIARLAMSGSQLSLRWARRCACRTGSDRASVPPHRPLPLYRRQRLLLLRLERPTCAGDAANAARSRLSAACRSPVSTGPARRLRRAGARLGQDRYRSACRWANSSVERSPAITSSFWPITACCSSICARTFATPRRSHVCCSAFHGYSEIARVQPRPSAVPPRLRWRCR